MSQQRLKILKYVAALLDQAQIVSVPVTINRGEPPAQLPAIGIFGLEDRPKVLEDAPRRYIRTIMLQVDIHVGDDEPNVLNDQAHALADAVERVLIRDQYLGKIELDQNLANDVRLTSTNMMFGDGGRVLLAGVAIQFEIDYVYETVDDSNPSVAAFVRAHIDWDFPSAGDPIDAQDDVEDLQG